MSNNKEGIREKCEYADSKLMMNMERTCIIYMKKEYRKKYAAVICLPILLPSVQQPGFSCTSCVRYRYAYGPSRCCRPGACCVWLLYAYGLSRCCHPGCLQLKWRRRPYLLKRRLLKGMAVFRRTMHNRPM